MIIHSRANVKLYALSGKKQGNHNLNCEKSNISQALWKSIMSDKQRLIWAFMHETQFTLIELGNRTR